MKEPQKPPIGHVPEPTGLTLAERVDELENGLKELTLKFLHQQKEIDILFIAETSRISR